MEHCCRGLCDYDYLVGEREMKKIFVFSMLIFCLICSCCSPAYADPYDELAPGDSVTTDDGTIVTATDDGLLVVDLPDSEEPEDSEVAEELPEALEAVLLQTEADLFLYKDFNSYTVTEGFLLLFLLLAFCWVCWIIIRGGVFRG